MHTEPPMRMSVSKTAAERQRREDIADILWMLLAGRRRMLTLTRQNKGILHDAAWDSYATICRQIALVRELANAPKGSDIKRMNERQIEEYDRMMDRHRQEGIGWLP